MTQPNSDTPSASALHADNIVTTHHTLRLGDRKLKYTARAGTLVLREESADKDGKSEGLKAKAEVFFVAYTLDDAPQGRPLTFSFNGGPGSSSVWLHLGLLGPKRVKMGDAGNLLPPPYDLIDNEHTLLDVTDLVFVDPIGTGYSRAVQGEADKAFHGFKRDIESVGDFIRTFVSREKRWLSPKFLIGESYGTTRAAGLSGYLGERHGLFLNGIMLVSSILDFGTVREAPGNDLPFVLMLPTMTATAWYHGKIDGDLPKLLNASEAFASGPYLAGLFKGAKLGGEERSAVRRDLARFTGLSEDFVERCDLRVSLERFQTELLRERGVTVGRLDSRFVGKNRDLAATRTEYDPSYSAIQGPYTAAMNHLVRGELAFESDLPYEILSFKVFPQWSYAEFENRYVDVSDTLRRAMNQNPALRVHVASGYFDFATPYYAAKYTFSHLGVDADTEGRVEFCEYPAGHMMYVHEESLARQRRDLGAFIEQRG
ncbi:S10 family peptidase [Deinococcus yavapaiensis]|uniref:Carboxypeptidase C (Cathepsin A) n=1 Tax=Deinococcus yavapaiensis KR-236 TaxID=694435 RepID=A0A318S952_9DEIO|nr:peptidase S10 [Deinococcus yavapaiensis]PYE54748.1 carboxypeptidase C (cathepsin A) [Deinococcus yavapaiensis KR-236]